MQSFAIIPAAGRSQRMGQPKLLLPWGEGTILEAVLAAWRASRVTHVILVVHPDDARLAEIGRAAGADVVRPEAPPVEMRHSVELGLARAARFHPGPEDAWLLAPADMPLLHSETIDRLIAAYAAAEPEMRTGRIWIPRHAERRGHPVLFPWPLAAEVAGLGAHEGLNVLVARQTPEYVEAGQDAIFEDLDTPEDYQRLRARAGK